MGRNPRAKRHAKRLMVELWEHSSGRKVTGFTTNISATGMYVATRTLLAIGARVRVQLKQHDVAFAVEAEIVRVLKQPLELRSIQSDGVGVRFLSVDEMVRELLGGVEVRERYSATLPRPSAVRPDSPPPSRPELSVPSSSRRYRVTFRDTEHFRRIVERDMRTGGLYLTTAEPPPNNERIVVEIEAPGASEPVLAWARVVYSGEAFNADGSPNLLAGVGVELDDKESVLEALTPALVRCAAES